MGIIKKERMKRQEEAIESKMVHIENPDGSGGLILVRQKDLNKQGFLIKNGNTKDPKS